MNNDTTTGVVEETSVNNGRLYIDQTHVSYHPQQEAILNNQQPILSNSNTSLLRNDMSHWNEELDNYIAERSRNKQQHQQQQQHYYSSSSNNDNNNNMLSYSLNSEFLGTLNNQTTAPLAISPSNNNFEAHRIPAFQHNDPSVTEIPPRGIKRTHSEMAEEFSPSFGRTSYSTVLDHQQPSSTYMTQQNLVGQQPQQHMSVTPHGSMSGNSSNSPPHQSQQQQPMIQHHQLSQHDSQSYGSVLPAMHHNPPQFLQQYPATTPPPSSQYSQYHQIPPQQSQQHHTYQHHTYIPSSHQYTSQHTVQHGGYSPPAVAVAPLLDTIDSYSSFVQQESYEPPRKREKLTSGKSRGSPSDTSSSTSSNSVMNGIDKKSKDIVFKGFTLQPDSNKIRFVNSDHQKEGINDGAWSDKEHELFLLGLEKCGKGRWRDIAEYYVRTRTRTQVASHAQKYFQKQKKVVASPPTTPSPEDRSINDQ
jgi:SHAQKYF class myb-like DNA-binding protein